MAKKDDRLFAPFPIEMDEHPKIIGLSDAAFRAVFEATFYSRRMLSDGFLDERVVLRRWGQEVADELSAKVRARPWWVGVEGGWRIHDFEKHLPLRAEIEAVREAKREAGRRGGVRSGEARRSNTEANGKQNASKTNPETETETETDPPSTKKGGAAKRGTRIPEPFMLTTAMREWAATEVPTVDVDGSTRRFVDYWRAETGAKATKLDWVATWRNWLRRDADNRKPTRPTPTERAQQTAAAGRAVAGRQITSLDPKGIES